jgi:hypothetical protein
MFSPQRAAKYLAKVVAKLLPVLGVVLVLGVLTNVRQTGSDWHDAQFWLGVAANVVLAFLAVLGAELLGARFVQSLYGIERLGEARGIVHRSLFGLFKFGPWVRVHEGQARDGAVDVLSRVGGPGHLVVYNNNAVLLQKAGRFTGVHSREFVPLERFEKLYEIVDLRPARKILPVNAMSKEGIPVTCEADIAFQIDGGQQPPSEVEPYPASQERVFAAATSAWIREASRTRQKRNMNWSDRVIFEAECALRAILAQYTLDRLIGLLSPGTSNPREEIRAKLEEELSVQAPALGARILGVELGDIRAKDEVTQQWIEAWKARWERWATERQAMGKARQAEQLENAKTRAQVMMLTTISEALRPLKEQEQTVTSKLVLTRLFMVLSRTPSDPLTRIYLPKEAMSTLQLLRDLIV